MGFDAPDPPPRPQVSNPFGKNTAEVKALVDEDTREALTALAFASGMNVSEYVRHLLLFHVHGHATMLKLAHQRSRGMAGIGHV